MTREPTAMQPKNIAAGVSEDWDRCGNEFNSLRDLIWWLIHHNPPPPPQDDWLRSLTQVAHGLQNVAYAMRIASPTLRTSLAREGLDQAKQGINAIKLEQG
jgi:hypothetical protein